MNEILNSSQIIQGMYISILLSSIFFISGIIVLRKNKVMHLINEKDKKEYKDNKIKLLYIIGILVLLMFIPIGDSSNTKTCYNYEKQYISNYDVTFYNRKNYNLSVNINNSNFDFILYTTKKGNRFIYFLIYNI